MNQVSAFLIFWCVMVAIITVVSVAWAINDLKPILGLELTATPFVETARGAVPFKNVVYEYALARAMQRDVFQSDVYPGGTLRDYESINPRDAGMRLILPGHSDVAACARAPT